MVSVKGDRGFPRLREYDDDLDNTDLKAQQKAFKRYRITEKGKQAEKRYRQSIGGKQKLYKYLHIKSQKQLDNSIRFD